jgi:N-acetylmuramoyl-L-alanine amidase
MGVKNRNLGSYTSLNIYIRGKNASFSGRIINGIAYLPIRKTLESLTAARVIYNSSQKTLTVSGAGYNMSVSDGAYVLYASDRPLFSMSPSVVLSDNAMYVPGESLPKALGLRLSYSGSSLYLSGSASPLRSASSYYIEDEVYWLARIINAESRGEPLLGQIAVGNVVLNRVSSSLYPNTIWGVIFDKKYGVQFSPVSNGTIYQEPTSTAILAAKICLEGLRTPGEPVYFLRPSASTSSWIVNNRPYVYTVGNHYFFG